MAPKHIVYTNAPLVEVIVEIKWQLTPVQSTPNAAIDPFLKLFEQEYIGWAERNGYPALERLVPEGIPPELLPYRPLLRLRREASAWPLIQLGPGLLTVNTVPPYDGWAKFSEVVKPAIQALFDCYPLASKSLLISQLELRYIDAFTDKLRLEHHNEFITKHLGVSTNLPDRIFKAYVPSPEAISSIVEIIFKSKAPKDSEGRIRLEPGTNEGKGALVMQFLCRSVVQKPVPTEPKALISWFDEAHTSIRDWFDGITSEELKKRMGPETEIGQRK